MTEGFTVGRFSFQEAGAALICGRRHDGERRREGRLRDVVGDRATEAAARLKDETGAQTLGIACDIADQMMYIG